MPFSQIKLNNWIEETISIIKCIREKNRYQFFDYLVMLAQSFLTRIGSLSFDIFWEENLHKIILEIDFDKRENIKQFEEN